MKRWDEVGSEVAYWFDYPGLYDAALSRVPEGGTLVEVGTWLGRSICYLAQWAKALGKPVTILSIDTCRGDNEDQYMHRTIEAAGGNVAGALLGNLIDCEVADVVTMIVAPGERAAKLFADHSLDFVFIDANHEYDSVVHDLATWAPKVKPGGLFAGHDYQGHGWDGVKMAVDEFFAANQDFAPHSPPLSVNCWSADRK